MIHLKYPLAALTLFAGLWALGFAAAQSPSKPFSHAAHFKEHSQGEIKDCTDCHRYDDQTRIFLRPAHEPCAGCHQESFTEESASGALCKTCHAQGSALKPLPDTREGFLALKGFSHDKHLNQEQAVSATFGRVLCDSCHNINQPDGKAGLPDHNQCGLCHGESAGASAVKPLLTSAARLSDCLGCHSDARTEPTVRPARQRSFQENAFGTGAYAADLIFSHPSHLTHTNDQACKECHQDVAADKEGKALHLPDMFSCAECHNDPAKVPQEKSMERCDTCHLNIRKGEKPPPGQHYGEQDHYAGAVQRQVQSRSAYCGWCHSKDPAVFPVQKSYTGSVDYYCGKANRKKRPKNFVSKPQLCVACHTMEQIDETPPKLCPK